MYVCVFWLQVSESSFVNGAITYNLTFIPTANLTMNCTVSNELGTVTKSIDISTCKYISVDSIMDVLHLMAFH